MWFFLAFFVAGFILTAFMSPKMKVENAKASGLDDLSFPRANEGDPVTRFYGTCKLRSPNTIGLGNFKPVPIKKKVKTGIFSSKKVITGYSYYCGADLAWALGPGVIYRKMWFGENLVWTGCLYSEDCYNEITINLPELYGGSKDGNRGGIGGTIAFYCGSFDQDADGWSETHLGADCPAYVGIAHTVFRDFYWGNSTNVDAVSMEAAYFPNTLGLPGSSYYMPNGLDANPIGVLYDIFKDDWGNLGFDAAKINAETWRDVAEVVYAEGNGISITVSSSTEAEDAVKQILRQVNAIIYEDNTTGLVEIKLIRYDYDIDDLPVLTVSEIKEIRNYSKKLWSESNNTVRVKYEDREAGYVKDKTAVAKDFALLRFQKKPRPVEVVMPGVKVADVANMIAARELSNLNVPLHTGEALVNRMAPQLKPGSCFVLVWPEYNIAQMICRVRSVGQGTLEDGSITLKFTSDEFASDATVISAPVPGDYAPNTYAPQDVETFKIIELPAYLDYNAGLGTRDGYSRLASFVKAPTSYTLGYDAYIEQVGEDAEVLNLAPYTETAELVAPIGRFDGWDNGFIDEVVIKNITDPTIVLNAENPRIGGNLVLIGDELLSYETATDNGDDTITLNDVHRAMFDTTWLAHDTDDVAYFFEGQEGFFETDSLPAVPQNVYFIDRTTSGSSPVDSAVVSAATPIGRVGRVIAPDYVTAGASRAAWQEFDSGDTVTIDARPRSRLETVTAWYENDAAASPEAGTTYRVSFEVEGVVTVVEDDVALPYDLVATDDMEGECIVLIEAKKDGLYSITAAPMPIIVFGPSVTIDGDLVLIDGEKVTIT